MLRHLRNFWRLGRVSIVLARYDALFLLERWGVAPALTNATKLLKSRRVTGRPGERLAEALQALGPTFIKLGQALSTRADLFGEEVTQDLAVLRDKLPPFSAETAREIIEEELERPVEELFQSFDDTPVAAASIAQVHFAVSKKGDPVAVKVLRPGIEEQFAADLELLFWMAGIADRTLEQAERLKLLQVAQTIADMVHVEMDLRMEAAAASELYDNFKDDQGFIVPRVDWSRTSRRVMTLERVHGTNIADTKALRAEKQDLQAICQKAAEIFFKQVFRDGFFHADMHPGNLFIAENGDIIAVDFGIMGRVEPETRLYLADILEGFLRQDYMKVAQVHIEAGLVPASESVEVFAQACRSIGEPLLNLPQEEISIGRLLGQMFKVAADFKMEVQPQLLLLQKTIMMVEGIGHRLNPQINMWQLVEPLIQQWARRHLGPEAKLKRDLLRARKVVTRVGTIIEAAEHIAACVTKDGVKLHPETVEALSTRRRGGSWRLALLTAALTALILFTAFSLV